jgi:membrane-associated protease RseP (regulator of RpoE activity)
MPTPSLQLLLPLLLAVAAPDGWLGVYLEPERDEAVVAEVIPNSPAAKAGLQVGDVVVRIGDETPVGRERMRATLAAGKPGDRLTLVVRRGAAEHRVVVRLGERPDAAVPKPEPTPRPSRPGVPPPPAVEAKPVAEDVPPAAPAPTQPPANAPSATPPVAGPAASAGKVQAAGKSERPDVEAELQALRAELEALRRQLEALRKSGGRE